MPSNKCQGSIDRGLERLHKRRQRSWRLFVQLTRGGPQLETYLTKETDIDAMTRHSKQFRCCWMHTSFLHDSRQHATRSVPDSDMQSRPFQNGAYTEDGEFFCMVLEPPGCSPSGPRESLGDASAEMQEFHFIGTSSPERTITEGLGAQSQMGRRPVDTFASESAECGEPLASPGFGFGTFRSLQSSSCMLLPQR